MPERPDYAALISGQLAVLDRINAGEPGLPVVQQLVRLAQEVLGARGAGFAEYAPGHGRIVAASGAFATMVGRRVGHGSTAALSEEFARHVEGVGHRVLGARCTAGDTVIGSLHISVGDGPTSAESGHDSPMHADPATEHPAVLELIAGHIGRLYATHPDLPVHGGSREAGGEQGRRRAEARDLWVAVTSHELRTPVTVIKGYADTLINHGDALGDDGRREAVRIIGTRAGELARLVDRLLAATSDDGEAGEAPGPFDLPEALREAVAELPADLRRRMRLDGLPTDLPKAFGERNTIAAILTELATNVEKYSPPGTPVDVYAGADEDTLRFRIADRGAGIAPEHVEKAFERYWQAESSGRRHPGAGLGLYLVRRLVERQNGWVSLRPREGGGTTAEVRLPRA